MNNKCVYLHRDSDGVVFYVGQGSSYRPYIKGNKRSKQWQERSKYGYTIEIIASGLTSTEAIELEEQTIKVFDNLVNTGSTKVKNIDFNYFNEWFGISESSPTGLVWKKANLANSPMNKKQKGDIAGVLSKRPCGKPSGYAVSLYSTKYQVHRVVWLLSGNILNSDMVIDHIDGNPLNNQLSNLRQIEPVLNARNNSLRHDNKSGHVGVQIDKMGKDLYVVATWYENGKQQRKAFNIGKYGEEQALQMAIDYRQAEIFKLNASGAGYSSDHGSIRLKEKYAT